MKDINMVEEEALLEGIVCVLIFPFERSIITKEIILLPYFRLFYSSISLMKMYNVNAVSIHEKWVVGPSNL